MNARALVNGMLFGGQHEAIIEHIEGQDEKVSRLTEERDAARRFFNRIEAAISHHKTAKALFADDADEALYKARDRVLRDYSSDSALSKDDRPVNRRQIDKAASGPVTRGEDDDHR